MNFVNAGNLIYIFLIILIWALAFLFFLIDLYYFSRSRLTDSILHRAKNFYSLRPGITFILKTLVSFLILVLFAIIILRPHLGVDTTQSSTTNLDIYFAIDTSQSMKVEDYPLNESRMQKAKDVLIEFVRNDTQNRYSLVSFNFKTTTELPLTFDKLTTETGIDTLIPLKSYAANGGSSITLAFDEILTQIEKSEEHDQFAFGRQKIIVLVTDGEEVGTKNKPWDQTVDKLKQKGVKVFTLGVGTKNGGKIPDSPPGDPNRGYVRFQAEDVISKLDAENMQKIARSGDGKYFEVNTSFDPKTLTDEFAKFLATTGTSKESTIYREVYFLISPFIILLLLAYHFELFNPTKVKYKKK